MGSRDIIKYVVVSSGILYSIIAIWECTPLITTADKAMHANFVLHNEGVQVQCNLY